jgi:hypothetical protein
MGAAQSLMGMPVPIPQQQQGLSERQILGQQLGSWLPLFGGMMMGGGMGSRDFDPFSILGDGQTGLGGMPFMGL